MQSLAKDVGCPETAFLHPVGGTWKARFFAPSMEIPFAGHAAIAAGVVLGLTCGVGVYTLKTNTSNVSVEAWKFPATWMAECVSPQTRTGVVEDAYLERLYECFGLLQSDLDPELPSRFVHAGSNHVLIALSSRRRLTHIGYSFNELLEIQREMALATISLVFRESEDVYHSRNAFAAGGLYEDPATGAAAAALGGYLRELRIKPSGKLRVIQGEDMGKRSEIFVDYDDSPGAGIRISGEVRVLESSGDMQSYVAVD